MSLLLGACSSESADEELQPSAAEAPAPGVLRSLDSPGGPGAMAPDLVSAGDKVLLTWLEPLDGVDEAGADEAGAGHALYVSELEDERWTPARLITSGEGFFANWADLPMAVEAADGSRFAHWLRKLDSGTYAYGVALARSRDQGETWDEIGLLHDDTSPTEHGFVSYVPLPESGIQTFWLDGRETATGGGMQLRTTKLTADEGPGPGEILDDRVCDCCSTDAAMAASGPVVAYRDRSETEIRDIAVIRATDEGWSEPVTIHDDGWQIHGCPVNGPAIAADGDRVAVAWFSAADTHPIVNVAFSEDAGATFGRPIVVDAGTPLGRVDVVLDAQGLALVSWLRADGEAGEIRWRAITPGGAQGPWNLVAETTAERSAGVPRMVRHGDQLLFAWVEDAEPSRLQTGLVALR